MKANASNWRGRPFNRWSFHNVDKVISSSLIPCDPGNTIAFEHHKWAKRGLLLNGRFLGMLGTDAVVALVDGRIAYEWYANGNDQHTPHIVMSCTKAVMGLLTGILDAQGAIRIDGRVSEYLPEMAGTAYQDATIRHLLDMRAGVVLDAAQSRAYEAATNWTGEVDTGAGSDLPTFFKSLKAPPVRHGGSFSYVSANTDLLGWAIERATGEGIAVLLSSRLWKPIGAEDDASITLDRTGLARASGGLSATARDFARLGQLMIDDGRRGTREIVPKSVIDDITCNGDPHAWRTGEWGKSFSAIGRNMNYRSGWYIVNDNPQMVFAMGIHGQNLFIDRNRRLVVAKMSSWNKPIERLPLFLTHKTFRGLQR